MSKILFRSSSLHLLTTKPRKKDEILSETAKSMIREKLLEDMFGYVSFLGSKETEKGDLLENKAIDIIGKHSGLNLTKNLERKSNDFITGECDIFVPEKNLVIDIKNSWSIGTHPFTQGEALKKAEKNGYIQQMQGYMWLWGAETAQISFILLPVPDHLVSAYDSYEQLVDRVNLIPEEVRITSIQVERDDEYIKSVEKFAKEGVKHYLSIKKEIEQKKKEEFTEIDDLF